MTVSADLVVIGGGPGGLSAALSAARAGVKVTLLDGYARPGGQYYLQPPAQLDRRLTSRQRDGRALWEQVKAAGVEIRSNALAWDLQPDLTLAAALPQGSVLIHPRAVVIATGAYERVPAFPGWTLPGVITSGAAQALLVQGVRPGKRALVCGTGPLQLTTARKLLHAGVEVAAVLESGHILRKGWTRAWTMVNHLDRVAEGLESLLELARRRSPYRTGWGILAAHGSAQVEGATIARLDENGRLLPGSEQEISCDTICIGYGLIPFNGLSRLAGALQEWRPELGGEIPLRGRDCQTTVPGLYAAGDGAGIGGFKMALIEGAIAGICAAERLGHAGANSKNALARLRAQRKRESAFQDLYAGLFTPGPGVYELAHEDTLICRCEGVTLGSLRQAALNLPFQAISEAKNLTRCGMGECQGRVCSQQVTYILAALSGKSPAEIGGYNPRPPLFSLPLEKLLLQDD